MIEQKQKERKVHGVKALVRMVVKDPKGKIIHDSGDKPSHSFLIQFLEYIYAQFRYTGNFSATATDGTEDLFYDAAQNNARHFRVDAAANDGTHGVVVGTGDTAETNVDYTLETKIAEGGGAGQLTHGDTTVTAAAVVGANVDLVVTRAFINGSGGAITVEEVGIYTKQVTPSYHCIIRDVLGASVIIPNLCSLSVIYTLRTTV